MKNNKIAKESQEKIELDLVRILKNVWRKAWLVLLAMLLSGGVGFFISAFVMEPEWQSTAMLYVNNSTFSVGSTSVNLSDLTASQSLVKTYMVILKTRRTLNAVIEEAGLDYTYGELSDMISSSSKGSTEIFNVTVTSSDPEEAAMIANTIVKVLPDKIAEVVDGSSVRTVDFAVVPSKRSGPDVLFFTMVGILFGLSVSFAGIVLLEFGDDTIHEKKYLLESYYPPVLAVIPDLSVKNDTGYYRKDYHA